MSISKHVNDGFIAKNIFKYLTLIGIKHKVSPCNNLTTMVSFILPVRDLLKDLYSLLQHYKFRHHPTGSDTILTGSDTATIYHKLYLQQDSAAVSDKTCCLTTFQFALYRTLYMKHYTLLLSITGCRTGYSLSLSVGSNLNQSGARSSTQRRLS